MAVLARRADRLQQLAEQIEADGQKALVIEADVSVEEHARGAVERTVSALGRLDTLVNNAGVMLLGPIEDAPLDEWRTMVHANVFGVLYCTHAAVPVMKRQGSGHIVNVSSVAGRFARAGSGVYNLTKFGVGAFSEALRQETVALGLRVTVVEPGAVATELPEHNRPEIREQIMQRFGDTERLEAHDIADAIAYIVTRPRHVAVNELLVRPTEQQA